MHSNRLKQRNLLLSLPKINRLGIVILISSLSFAFIGTVWAVYLNSFLHSEALVGLVSSFFLLVSLISYFLIIPIIEKTNKAKIYISSSILVAIGYFLYGIINNFYFFIIAALIVSVSVTLKIASMGIIIKHSSKKRELSKNEGFLYMVANISWVLGPLIVGVILRELNVRWVFIGAAFLALLSVLIFRLIKTDCKIIKKKIDRNPIKNFISFFKSKDRRKVYLLGIGSTFWWSLVFIYFPLIIIKNLHEDYVGYLLFAVMIPLVLTQYSFGKLAGRIGFKKMFFIGYLIPATAAIVCFIFFNIWVISIALIIASIGIAMTESTTESYFFDICKGKEDQRFYAPYNTAIDVGQIVGELAPALVLLFLPMKFIFIVYASGLIFLSLLALTIRDIIEEKPSKKRK